MLSGDNNMSSLKAEKEGYKTSTLWVRDDVKNLLIEKAKNNQNSLFQETEYAITKGCDKPEMAIIYPDSKGSGYKGRIKSQKKK
jgi:hypothetical protein